MTGETDTEVRNRLRRLELPEAPQRLHGRVVEVAATRPRPGSVTRVARSSRLLVPIAAMLLIGGAAILGPGGGPRPTVPPSHGEPVGPAIATVQLLAANYEVPAHAGGLAFHLELEGLGVPWRGRLEYAELGQLRTVSPPLPPKLPAGSYSLRTEVRVSGDVIYPGESGPRDYGAAATCTSEFVVTPETRVVSITLSYWADQRCTAGTITAEDPRTLATFLDMPSFGGACGEDVGGCDYRLQLSGPGGSWGSVYHTVRPPDQLVRNSFTDLPLMLSPGTYRLDASSHRMSREPEPGVGWQSEIEVAGTCFVEFTVGPEMNQVLVTIDFRDETCTASADVDLIPTAPPPSAVGPIATPAPTPGASAADEAPIAVACSELPLFVRSCDEAVAAVEATLDADDPRVVRIDFRTICSLPAPEPACGVSNIADVTFRAPGGMVRYSILQGPDGLTAERSGADASAGTGAG